MDLGEFRYPLCTSWYSRNYNVNIANIHREHAAAAAGLKEFSARSRSLGTAERFCNFINLSNVAKRFYGNTTKLAKENFSPCARTNDFPRHIAPAISLLFAQSALYPGYLPAAKQEF